MVTRTVLALTLLLALSACDSAEERKVRHYEEGLQLEAEGVTDKAIIAFRNALRIDDAYAPPYFELGKIFKAQNNAPQAAAHLLKFVELQPDRVDARLDLAEALIGMRRIDDAAPQIDAALQLEPENPTGLALLSAVQLARGDLTTAVETARQALAGDPDQPLGRLTLIAERVRVEDFDGALAEIAEAEQRMGDDPMLGVIRLGVLERKGDREGVGAELRKLYANFPDNRDVALSLSRWHMQGDPPDTEAAEAIMRALVARAPDDFDEAMRLVGFLNAARGAEAARDELARLAGVQGPGKRFDRALAAFEAASGDIDAAKARLEAGIAATEGTEDADSGQVQLARLLDPVADAARRAELYEAVLARDSRNVGALTLRAEARIREDRYADAIQDLRTALAEAPQSADLLELLAVAHERDGAPELARERRALAVQASDYSPEPTLRYAGILLSEGDAATAEGLIRDALARAPQDRRLLAALAQTRLARGDTLGAEEVAQAVEALGADSDLEQRIRAGALLQEGRIEEGSALLRATWEASGGARDLETLVQLYVSQGETEKAHALVDSALAADPTNRTAHLLRAGLRRAAGDEAGAQAAVEAAIENRPDDGDLYAILAQLREGGDDRAGAIAVVEAGLQRSPDNGALRFRRARLLESEGRFEDAIAEYETLYVRDPGNILVANNLASLMTAHRDDEASLARAATIARRLRDAPAPALRDTYGWALFRMGSHQEALAILRETTAALDGEALAHFHLGMAYDATGDAAAAQQHLERAIALADAGSQFHDRARREAEAVLARLLRPEPSQ